MLFILTKKDINTKTWEHEKFLKLNIFFSHATKLRHMTKASGNSTVFKTLYLQIKYGAQPQAPSHHQFFCVSLSDMCWGHYLANYRKVWKKYCELLKIHLDVNVLKCHWSVFVRSEVHAWTNLDGKCHFLWLQPMICFSHV